MSSESQQESQPLYMRLCETCSRVLLPDSVVLESGVLDLNGNRNRKACKDLLRRLTSTGVQASVSKARFRAAVQRGCVICKSLEGLAREFAPLSSQLRDYICEESIRHEDEDKSLTVIFTATEQVPTGVVHGDALRSRNPIYDISWLQAVLPYANLLHEFKISTSDSSLSSAYVTSRNEYQPTLAIQRARYLARKCQREHDLCRIKTLPELPTRVIVVDPDDEITVRILATGKRPGSYTALSYCWGNRNQTLLTTENLSSMQDALLVASLPRTISDAIHSTRQLGLDYLWVDALCILQDDEDDKAREISSMSEIFSNANITIRAARGNHADAGFLSASLYKGNEDPDPAAQLYYPCVEQNRISLVELRLSKIEPIIDEPLHSRAWALQEGMLASGTLTFASSRAYWECHETFWNLGDLPNFTQQGADLRINTDDLNKVANPGQFWRRVRIYFLWGLLVADYSGRTLTHVADRLPALAGIAKRFQFGLKEAYLAGMWEGALPATLAWTLEHRGSQEPEMLPIASWSWASREGKLSSIGYVSKMVNHATRLVDFDIKVANENAPLSQIEYGIIKLQGRIALLNWNGSSNFNIGKNLVTTFHIRPDWRSKVIRGADGNDFLFKMPPGKWSQGHRMVALVPITSVNCLLLSKSTRDNRRWARIGLATCFGGDLEEFVHDWREQVIEIE